jgi:hypothetical protein
MPKDSHIPEHDTFIRMMRYIPEGTVRARELNCLLAEYEAALKLAAEASLTAQGEPLTEETLNAEMARIDRENAHAIALNLDQICKECVNVRVLIDRVKHQAPRRVKHG